MPKKQGTDEQGSAQKAFIDALRVWLDRSEGARESTLATVVRGASEETLEWFFTEGRANLAERAVVDRADLLGQVLREACDAHGRAWLRERLKTFAPPAKLLEEELEQVLRAFLYRGGLTVADLARMDRTPDHVPARLWRRLQHGGEGGGPAVPTLDTPLGAPPSLQFAMPPPLALDLAVLLKTSLVQTDLHAAGLDAVELQRARVPDPGARRAALHDWLERRCWPAGRHPDSPVSYVAPAMGCAGSAGVDAFSVHVVSLLHMRQLLDTPALGRTGDWLQRMEFSMPALPMLLMHDLGVVYSPEIRLPAASREGDTRLLQLWTEQTAEAMAVLFLERTLLIDFETLQRLNPVPKQPTPDFDVLTQQRQRVVFECKGSSSRKTHREQRARAQEQLLAWARRQPGVAMQGPSGLSKPELMRTLSTRLMALAFFAARVGQETRSGEASGSLLHVMDPPAPIGTDESEESARRRHQAAVLQAAGLFEAASRHLQHLSWAPEDMDDPPPHRFKLGKSSESVFVGRYLSLAELARKIGHPRAEQLGQLRMFTGLPELLYEYWQKSPGKPLPPDDRNKLMPEQSMVGALPGATPLAPSIGVFSWLGNGAFLALGALP